MKERTIKQYVLSQQTRDGAGVKLRRVAWDKNAFNIDPFLLLDTFESTNPEDYLKGFPTHPHRGIETFTYVIEGDIKHRDSLGNVGEIASGQYQWMTAGSGILHEEMPQKSDFFLGMQLWINMPKDKKMSEPSYIEGNKDNIPTVESDDYILRILGGSFAGKEKTGVPFNTPVQIYDIDLKANSQIEIPVDMAHTAFVSVLLGRVYSGDSLLENKSAAIFADGDTVKLHTKETPARVMFFSGQPLNQPIAWGGPIVMNTREELNLARKELGDGTFIKHEIKI